MNYYEHTFIAKQDLTSKDINSLKDKYAEIIKTTEGKVHKIEEWGLLNFARKLKNHNKGYYVHYKFEGSGKTLDEIKKKINIDDKILKYFKIKYKKLDLKNEYFKKKE